MMNKKWFIFLASSLFFFYEAIQMAYINTLGPFSIKALHLNAIGLSSLSAAYYLATVIFLIPAGYLLDRFDIKKVVLLSLGSSILATIGFALSQQLSTALLFRFLSGATGGAMSFIVSVRIAALLFANNRFSLAVGVIITIGMFGGIVAQTPFLYLINMVNWKNAVLLYSSFGLVILFINYLALNQLKQYLPRDGSSTNQPPFMHSFTQIIRNPYTWLIAIYMCILDAPVGLFGTVWGEMYLSQAKQINPIQASLITSMLFFGTMIGCPLYGWIADRLKITKALLLIGATVSLALIITVNSSLTMSSATLASLFFALGLFSSSQTLGYPLIIQANPPVLLSLVSSITSIIVLGGGALLRQVFGMMLELQSQANTVDTSHAIYPGSAYHNALYLVIVGFVIAIVFSLIPTPKEAAC